MNKHLTENLLKGGLGHQRTGGAPPPFEEYFIELNNNAKFEEFDIKEINQIKKIITWHKELYRSNYDKIKNKTTTFSEYYNNILDSDYPMLRIVRSKIRKLFKDYLNIVYH